MRTFESAFVLFAAASLTAPASADPAVSPTEYLDSAIASLRTNHVNRERVDWERLEAEAREMAEGAQTSAETYDAILHVVAELGEKHTTFLAPPTSSPAAPGTQATAASSPKEPSAVLDGDRIGYLRVAQYVGSREAGRGYADLLRDGLHRMADEGACGFVVDLRGNSGGNVWPMLDGVASLLGTGNVLTFDVPAQGHFKVLIEEGVAYQEGAPPPYALDGYEPLADPFAPVAILTDGDTASSAEALAIAFAGRANTRRFGATTAGYATVNMPVELADGAVLFVTVGWNVDRTGHRWEAALAPDVSVPAGMARDQAVAWLLGHPACNSGMAGVGGG